MSTCIFCKIITGGAPAHVIWKDKAHVAFLSIFPNTPGFTVVATREHLGSYVSALPEDAFTGLMLAARNVGLLLDRALEDVGRTGLIAEGFGVDHAHVKLFPMHGTAPMEKWRPIRSDIDTMFEHYEGYISSHDGPRADDAELTRIAEKIRRAAQDGKTP